jgi:hypothetical protein
MFAMDNQGNWTDQNINANSGMDIDVDGTIDSPDEAIPFDHSQRLSDKLFGAVGVALDGATQGIQIQNLKNQATYKQMSGQTSITTLPLTTWIEKNILLIFLSVFMLMFLGVFKR